MDSKPFTATDNHRTNSSNISRFVGRDYMRKPVRSWIVDMQFPAVIECLPRLMAPNTLATKEYINQYEWLSAIACLRTFLGVIDGCRRHTGNQASWSVAALCVAWDLWPLTAFCWTEQEPTRFNQPHARIMQSHAFTKSVTRILSKIFLTYWRMLAVTTIS